VIKKYDHDGDNVISDQDLHLAEREQQIELDLQRASTRRKMSIVALAAMVGFTIFLFTPVIDTDRVKALSDISSMFYLTMSGIIAAYFGTSAWLSKN
jgi:hypothetical protein